MSNSPDPASHRADTAPASRQRQFFRDTRVAVAALAAGCAGSDDTTGGSPSPTALSDPDDNATPATDPDPDPAPEMLGMRARALIALQANGLFVDAHDRLVASSTAELSVGQLRRSWQQIAADGEGFGAVAAVNYTETTDGPAQMTVETKFSAVRNMFTVFIDPSSEIEGYRLTDQSGYDWAPPAYADRPAFSDTPVTLTATEECELGETVLSPTDGESVPGAIIIHGSGPTDRDGTHGPNKPYKQLAWGLASRGVPTLR